MVCEGCDRGSHVVCCGLARLPNCGWYCSKCEAKTPVALRATLQLRTASARARRRGTAAAWSEEEEEECEEEDFVTGGSKRPGGRVKMQLLAVERRVKEAKRQVWGWYRHACPGVAWHHLRVVIVFLFSIFCRCGKRRRTWRPSSRTAPMARRPPPPASATSQ